MKIRVAIFAPALITGGTQRHIQQVVLGLDRERFEVIVYALRPGGEVADELVAAGITVRVLGSGERFLSLGTIAAIVRAVGDLRRERIRIVHAYQWRPGLVGAIAGRLARVPVVLASKRSLSGEASSERRGWRVISRLVDGIVVNADALRIEAESHGIRSRWVVVRNGIDVGHFRSVPGSPEAGRRALDLAEDVPTVGSVGRLEGRKGHDDLLQALARLKSRAGAAVPQAILVGDGPARPALERLAKELGIADMVRFVGTVADVRPWLGAMDAFVLPSREEGSSNAALEAMACGRAVIATDVGGTTELIEDGRTGLIVPPSDPGALASALVTILDAPAHAGSLGAAARSVVEERYAASRMVRELESLWAACLERGWRVWGLTEEVRSA